MSLVVERSGSPIQRVKDDVSLSPKPKDQKINKRARAAIFLIGATFSAAVGITIGFLATPLIGGVLATLSGVAAGSSLVLGLTIVLYKITRRACEDGEPVELETPPQEEVENGSTPEPLIDPDPIPCIDRTVMRAIKLSAKEFPDPNSKLQKTAQEHPNIEQIEMHYPDEDIDFDFSKFRNLQSITFSGCRNLSDAAVASLANCANLHTVNLRYNGNLSDAATASLAKCPNLRTIDLSFCKNLTDATAVSLATCPNLQTVKMSWAKKLTDAAAASLAACPNLQTIDLSYCKNLTDAAAASLATCPKLHTVNLSRCYNLTDAATASLATCPKLHTVNLRRCYNLTDAAATSLATRPNLHTIDLRGNWRLTAAAKRSLAHCPNLSFHI